MQISLLRQKSFMKESLLALELGYKGTVPVYSCSLENISQYQTQLKTGKLLPVGSVEFLLQAFHLTGCAIPENISYPKCLFPFLKRNVTTCKISELTIPCFVKPMITKTFTGFVYENGAATLNEHISDQIQVLTTLPHDTNVWTSEVVHWISEYRYYICSKQIIGFSRYDEADNPYAPDNHVVEAMGAELAKDNNFPSSYGLDIGVLDTGITALIEVNDAWALGYYKSENSPKPELYFSMLFDRWDSIFRTSIL